MVTKILRKNLNDSEQLQHLSQLEQTILQNIPKHDDDHFVNNALPDFSMIKPDNLQTFTISSALSQVGGFGRFQIIALILLMIIRNYGLYQFYQFGLSTEHQRYVCRDTPNEKFRICSTDYICSKKSVQNFEYVPDRTKEDFLENWYVELNLICEDNDYVNSRGSLYFIGYGLGVIFFFMPQTFGRKGTMNRVLPFYIFSCYFAIFPKSLEARAFGFFLQGIFHLKISTSYTHILELVEEKDKAMCSTILTGFDSGALLIACTTYLYYKPDE